MSLDVDEDEELQQAILLSRQSAAEAMCGATGAITPGLGTSVDEHVDEDEELQRVILASMTDASPTMHSCAALASGGLFAAPVEVRKLLLTVTGNLRRASSADCDPTDAAKFRQLNDDAIKKRAAQTADPSKAHALAVDVLQSLGFVMTGITNDDGRHTSRWVVSPEIAKQKVAILEETYQVLAASNEAQGKMSTPSVVQQLQVPNALSDFDVLPLHNVDGLPTLSLLMHPRGHSQVVLGSDAAAWASHTGSRRSYWGSHGRRGEDDRVTLTLFCGIGLPHVACVAHWYDHRGDERTQPSLTCQTGQWRWCSTYMNQVFVLRLLPQQQVVLAGFSIAGRPYGTDGHLIAMLLPSAATVGDEPMRICREIMASLPKDDREPPALVQGRAPAPPPPGGRNRRGPFG